MSCTSIVQVLMNYIKNKIQRTNAFECNDNDLFADVDPDFNFIHHAKKIFILYNQWI